MKFLCQRRGQQFWAAILHNTLTNVLLNAFLRPGPCSMKVTNYEMVEHTKTKTKFLRFKAVHFRTKSTQRVASQYLSTHSFSNVDIQANIYSYSVNQNWSKSGEFDSTHFSTIVVCNRKHPILYNCERTHTGQCRICKKWAAILHE